MPEQQEGTRRAKDQAESPSRENIGRKDNTGSTDNQRDWGVFRQPHPRSEQLSSKSCACLLSCGSAQSGWAGWTLFWRHQKKVVQFWPSVMQLAQRSQTALLTVVSIGSPAQKPSSSRGGVVSLHRAPRSIPEVRAGSSGLSRKLRSESQGQFISMGWKSRLNALMGDAHHRKVRLCVALYMKQRSQDFSNSLLIGSVPFLHFKTRP